MTLPLPHVSAWQHPWLLRAGARGSGHTSGTFRWRSRHPQDRLDHLTGHRGFVNRLLDVCEVVELHEALEGQASGTVQRREVRHERLRDGIAHERRMLAKLRLRADRLIDTSDFAPGDLRRLVEGLYGLNKRGQLAVCVTSFSYRLGVPREADLVFDARFLRNPHYVPALKPHTGLDKDVGAYVAADDGFDEFFDSLTHLLTLLLPRFAQEGKSYLTIAIGCTGGRHRSVYVAETLASWLRRQRFDASSDVLTVHRDIHGGGSGAESPTRKTKPPRAPQVRRGAAQTTRAGKANSGKTRGR